MKRRMFSLLLAFALILTLSPAVSASYNNVLRGGNYSLVVSGAVKVEELEFWVATLDPDTGVPSYAVQPFTVIYLPDSGATLDLSCLGNTDSPSAWGIYTTSTVLSNGALYVDGRGASGPFWSEAPVKKANSPLMRTYTYPEFSFSLVFQSDAAAFTPASALPGTLSDPQAEDRITYLPSATDIDLGDFSRFFTCSQGSLGTIDLEVGRFSYENPDPFLPYTVTEITQATLFLFPAGTLITAIASGAVSTTVGPFDKSSPPQLLHSFAPTEPGKVYVYDVDLGTGASRQLYFAAAGPEGLNTPLVSLPFSQRGQQVDSWALSEVNSAIASGLSPAQFDYMDLRVDMTRAQFAAVAVALYEALSGTRAPTAANPFSDTSDPNVIKAYALGITTGTGDGSTFTPDGLLTREQAATMLSRVYTILGGVLPETDATSFADNAQISGWAVKSVAFMSQQGIINGVGNNTFLPQSRTQIQIALLLSLRMYNALR